MDAIFAAASIVGSISVMVLALLRILAYRMRLRAIEEHNRAILTARPEQLPLLTAPPSPPDLSKHTAFVLVMGTSAACFGLLARPQNSQRARRYEAAADAPAAPLLQSVPPDMELLASHCTKHEECGVGCRCVHNSCECRALERRPEPAPAAAPVQQAPLRRRPVRPRPEPQSSLASLAGRNMAGDLAYAGAL